MKRVLLIMIVGVLAISGFSFMGVEAANIQENVFGLYARLDAGLITLMYPFGAYDMEDGISVFEGFDFNNIFFGLNLGIPLGGIHLRGAAYTTVGDFNNYMDTQKLGIYGRVGLGLDILFIRLEGGVRLYYLFGDPEFEFSFDPTQYYFAVGLAF